MECPQVQKLAKNEVLMVNIGSLSTGGRVQAVKADLAKIGLTNPVCTEIGEKIALSRRVEKHWRYVGLSSVVEWRNIRGMWVCLELWCGKTLEVFGFVLSRCVEKH